jgi:hypothetical protein
MLENLLCLLTSHLCFFRMSMLDFLILHRYIAIHVPLSGAKIRLISGMRNPLLLRINIGRYPINHRARPPGADPLWSDSFQFT